MSTAVNSMHGCHFGPAPRPDILFIPVASLDKISSSKEGVTLWSGRDYRETAWNATVGPKGGPVHLNHSTIDKHRHHYVMTLLVANSTSIEVLKEAERSKNDLHEVYLYLQPVIDKPATCYLDSFAPIIKGISIQKSISSS